MASATFSIPSIVLLLLMLVLLPDRCYVRTTKAAITASPPSSLQQWPNTTDFGVHTFLTFDTGVSPSSITADRLSNYGSYGYVWGASLPHVPLYTKALPSLVTSKYIPYAWAPNASQSLAWWQRTHPSFVLYKCDRKTPAWYGGLVNRNMPLDVTNPGVVQWQVNEYARVAAAAGYESIAADMFKT